MTFSQFPRLLLSIVTCIVLTGCEDSDLRLGREALNAGDYDKALSLFGVAADRNRSDPSVRALIARAHARKGNLREAIQALREAERLGLSDKEAGRRFQSADLLDAVLFLSHGFEEGRAELSGHDKAERTASLGSITYRALLIWPANSPGRREHPDSNFMTEVAISTPSECVFSIKHLDAYSRGSSLEIKSVISTIDYKIDFKNATRFEIEQKDVLLEGKGILCEPDKCFDKTSFPMFALHNNHRANQSAVIQHYQMLIDLFRKVCPGQAQ